MKNITATILTLAMLVSLTACGEGNDIPANTTGGARPSPTEVTTTVTTTETETTTVTTVGDDTHIVPSDTTTATEAVDIEALLEGYAVYETDATSYNDVVNAVAKDNLGNFFAVRFTDVQNCAIVFNSEKIGDHGNYNIKPITAYIFGQTLDLTFDGHTLYGYDNGFMFSATSDVICVGMYPSCYIVSQNDVVLLDGSNDVVYYIEKNSNEFSYSKWSKMYHIGQQALSELEKAYTSDNDFVCEFGRIVLTEEGISLVTDEKYNAGEWYKSDRLFEHYKKYRNLPGCETIGGLIAMEKEYISSRAFEEYDKFEDWVIQKKG